MTILINLKGNTMKRIKKYLHNDKMQLVTVVIIGILFILKAILKVIYPSCVF